MRRLTAILTMTLMAAAGIAIFHSGSAGQSSASGGTLTGYGTITPGDCASWQSTTQVKDSGGACGGGGTVAGSGTVGTIPVFVTNSTTIGNSLLTDTGTALSYSGTGGIDATSGFTAVSDGVHAGIASLIGNTTNPSLPSNSFGFLGPASASFTSWFIQPPSTGPSASCLEVLGAVSANISALTCTASPSVTTITTSADASIHGLTVGLGLAVLGANVAVGNGALAATTSGNANVGVGYQALNVNTSGASNVAVGYLALAANVSVNSNTGIGSQALTATTGGFNVGVGSSALSSNVAGVANTAVGYLAGVTGTSGNANVSGNDNTWIGYGAGPGSTTQFSNSTAIGNGALNTASNQAVIGNSSVTDVYFGSSSAAANIHAAALIGLTTPLSAAQGGTGVANTATLTLGTSNQNYAALGTGIVFNTTTTGALTNATSAQILAACTGCAPLVSPSFTTPALGAATATSLLATGIVDGKVPVTLTTGTTATLGAATYQNSYTYNQEATAATGVTYTLPATAAGLQYCVKNSIVSGTGAPDTGVLTVYPPASSYVIINGVINTIGGGGTHGVASGGAAADSACFVAIDATHWDVYVQSGTWTAN